MYLHGQKRIRDTLTPCKNGRSEEDWDHPQLNNLQMRGKLFNFKKN